MLVDLACLKWVVRYLGLTRQCIYLRKNEGCDVVAFVVWDDHVDVRGGPVIRVTCTSERFVRW